MEKVDLKKGLEPLYKPSAKAVAEVDVPEFTFLMVDGEGDPNTSQEYKDAVAALFAVSYAAKFALKKEQRDYTVMPLEGLWWAEDYTTFLQGDKAAWQWTMMIRQPSFLTAHVFASARQKAQDKGLRAALKLRLQAFAEGRAAQILHIGPFAEEGAKIKRLHDYIESKTALRGKHHEIYLSDVRRAAPEKWKTILRQPMV